MWLLNLVQLVYEYVSSAYHPCCIIPLLFVSTVLYAFFHQELSMVADKKYQAHFKLKRVKFQMENIKRCGSIIGSTGSGKTESVVYNFLQHFSKHQFCGIMHDYKDFELIEIAYPHFKEKEIQFYTISFDSIYNYVNPMIPRYIPNEEDVSEISKGHIENLLKFKESGANGISKFFNDAVEGLLGGLIWKLKTWYPQYCTIPHVIAVFQHLNTKTGGFF